jgi:hypothetical protein
VKNEPPVPAWERWLAPRALLCGIAVAFLCCCAAGQVASRLDFYGNFQRFHQYLCPLTLYYPTASEVCQVARHRLDPAKSAVIVGGSSILNGWWQGRDGVWTKALAADLGERYQVLNLASIAARGTEFGGVAAEALSRDYPDLVLVIDLPPGHFWQTDPDGNVFKYFFWDAYYKGLLLACPEREARLQEELTEPELVGNAMAGSTGPARSQVKGERQAETRTQMACDRLCCFDELWNAVTYRGLATMWTPLTRYNVLRPRGRYQDEDNGRVPPSVSYPENVANRLNYLRGVIQAGVRPAEGGWVENRTSGSWAAFDRAACNCVPGPMRRRTVVVVVWESPYYRQHLSADEQAAYAALSRLTVQHLQALGFASVEVGPGLTSEEYLDHCHLMRAGGVKMAAAVAPAVEQVARRLKDVK